MNDNWANATLGEVAKICTGKLDSNAATTGGRYPFFTCSPDTLTIDTYAFDDEAVLLAGNNANGVFCVKHYRGMFNAYQRTYVISPRTHHASPLDISTISYGCSLAVLARFQSEYATKF